MNRPNRPDGLVSRTREAFLRNRIPLDAPTVLGVSGGMDSMSLLHALWELRVPVEARHVNYGLRGADSDADEAAVRATCDRLGIPLRVHRADPPPSPAPDGLQAWARRIRTSFLSTSTSTSTSTPTSTSTSTSYITAHHADDQTETVLLHLLRAADPLALAGMRELSTDGCHFRPWLQETHAEIQRYASARGVEWREDASNQSQVYLRNRIRHEVVPLLEALRPGASAHVAQLAQRFAPLADAAERAVAGGIPSQRGARARRGCARGRGPCGRGHRSAGWGGGRGRKGFGHGGSSGPAGAAYLAHRTAPFAALTPWRLPHLCCLPGRKTAMQRTACT